MTPTAVSAQPTEKSVDVGEVTTDPLLLRAARGEVSYSAGTNLYSPCL